MANNKHHNNVSHRLINLKHLVQDKWIENTMIYEE